MRRIGKLARRTTQMKSSDEPQKVVETPQPPQSIEQMMNTLLYSIIAKHQHAVYNELMQLQKSLQQATKKEGQDEKN